LQPHTKAGADGRIYLRALCGPDRPLSEEAFHGSLIKRTRVCCEHIAVADADRSPNRLYETTALQVVANTEPVARAVLDVQALLRKRLGEATSHDVRSSQAAPGTKESLAAGLLGLFSKVGKDTTDI
jgi:hypothetical protein